MNTTPDGYLTDGCGRCPLHATPQCKVYKWPQELAHFRRIVLDCGLRACLNFIELKINGLWF